MKKILIFYSVVLSLFLLSVPHSSALGPIIIDRAEHTYPQGTSEDQNYIPSDPTKIETTTIIRTIPISQTFNPIISGTNPDGTPIYANQTIDEIEQKLDSREINTFFFRQNYSHFAQPLANPLDNIENIKQAFTSYFLPQSSNATRRSLPESIRRCQISNQILDIADFIRGGNSVCIDNIIAVPQFKLRVGEIIYALSQMGHKLYYPDTSCPANQEAQPLPSSVSQALASKSYQIRLSEAQYFQLYRLLEPVCSNSLAQAVKHCDMNDRGETSNCEEEARSEALGSVPAHQQIYNTYRPASQIAKTKDYGQIATTPAIEDKPNPLSWLARFFKAFFDGALSDTKTFTESYQITTKIDNRQLRGLESHESTLMGFIPKKDQTNLGSGPNSGSNDVTLDPGESNLRVANSFKNLLTPKSWQ